MDNEQVELEKNIKKGGNSNNTIGEINYNNNGEKMIIIKYNNNQDILVEFENGYKCESSYNRFLNGSIKNLYTPSIYGVGYLGKGKYKTKINGNRTKEYEIWKGVLRRCFSEKEKERNHAYKDVTCCEEWLNFQVFAQWYNDNFYQIEGEKMELDKDILHKGNKIYSPDNCVFVSSGINNLFIKGDKRRNCLPIGVSFFKKYNKYRASCCIKGKLIGTKKYYDTPEDAFYKGYKPLKEIHIKEVADEYKEKIPLKLYEAMYNWVVEITD